MHDPHVRQNSSLDGASRLRSAGQLASAALKEHNLVNLNGLAADGDGPTSRTASSMSRYYFDVRDSSGFHRDEFGEDLDSFEAARMQCQCLLPDIAREELPDGEVHSITCDVRDEADRVVYRGKLTYEGTRFPATS
jgi:hypothetical protein